MTKKQNIELAEKIIKNFLFQHQDCTIKDLIRLGRTTGIDLGDVSFFYWKETPEGFDFWQHIYHLKLRYHSDLFNFLKKYYFCIESNNFIDLQKRLLWNE